MTRLGEPPIVAGSATGWPVDLTRSVVQVFGTDGHPVGTGFLVGPRLLVTCAHALTGHGRDDGPPTSRVTVVFAHLDAAERIARVDPQWWRNPEGADVAFLRLDEPPPAHAQPLALGESPGVRGHRVKAFGFPLNAPSAGHYGYGVAGDQILADGGAPLLQLTDCTEVAVGFSGSPVLDEHTGLVIGMVNSVASPDQLDRSQVTAYVTPTETLREVCPELTVSQVCPYRGLEPFTTADAVWFHGRDRVVHAVLASLRRDRRFLALLGPSGAGKSSLIHAGVLPALAGGALPDSDRWGWLSIRPGADPFAQLEQVGLTGTADGVGVAVRRWLNDHPEHERLVFIVDQLEELLVATPPVLRTALFEQLTLVAEQESGVTVIMGLRDDFYSRLAAAAPGLMRLVEQAMVNVPAVLDADELRAIIDQPATTVGMTLEPSLAEHIARDAMEAAPSPHAPGVGAAITVLPLLEFALTELWHRRTDGRLTHAAYQQIGGVIGGLARWCDQAYQALPASQRPLARRIVTSLVRLGDEAANIPPTRRRRTLDQLRAETAGQRGASEIDAVVAALADRRLLVTSRDPTSAEPVVELVHEALVREWGLLRQWLSEDHEFLLWRAYLETDYAQWTASTGGLAGHDPELLLRGSALEQARTWLDMRPSELSTELAEFIRLSDRTQHRRRLWRRTRSYGDRRVRTPSPATPSEVTDPPAEVVTDPPTEAVMDSVLSAAAEGIDQHSGVLSDLECAEDQLGVTDDVRTIARMLAALNTTPPLSIALLGDWGSGKSSFMRQVIERVDALAAASKPNPRRSAYATNVRQVRFNAWHYSDDHLWCGLVEHLFLELGDRGRDPNEDQRDNIQAELATEQAKLHRLNEDLRTVEAVSADAGWLGRLYHPFWAARVLRAVGKSLQDEIRAPKRLLTGLGFILLGAGLVVGSNLFGQSVIGWVAGAIAVVSGLLSPLVLAWRHVESFTKEAQLKLQDEKKKSEDSIHSLETQLDLIDPARRLESLLSAISSTDRYERYRGLTGRIRHDLDLLSRDLAAAQQRWATEGTDLPPPLQRIILYVDDLDRCTSSRVVEVLQAVNLLLSMPLFVVVVAVDPRWLLRALEEHHGRLLSGSGHARLAERRIRSLDYLDKIFHIPYAVRPMSHQGADYLRSLLPPVDESEHHSRIDKADRKNSTPLRARFIASDLDRERGQEETPTHRQGVADNEREAGNQEATTDQVAAGQVATDEFVASPDVAADQATTIQEATADEVAADQVAMVHEIAADRDVAHQDVAGNDVSANVQPDVIDLRGRELRLQQAERDFLPLLASLLPTPRTVKKLTNLYRLVRIGVPKDQLANFVGGDDGGPYQAVALLLATIVGTPVQAESFLLALSSATADPGRDIVDVLADLGEPPVANLLAERIRLIRKTLPVHGDVETYQKSVKAVARYSFETYRLFSK